MININNGKRQQGKRALQNSVALRGHMIRFPEGERERTNSSPLKLGPTFTQDGSATVVCWLLNVPATG